MIILPILTFYFLYIVVFDSDVKKLEWCGLGSVIVANFVIAAYVRMAWQEDKIDDNVDSELNKNKLKDNNKTD